jgi:HD superfamily phosphodiesterase
VPLSEGAFSLDDYVRYIREFIQHIGTAHLHVLSVCQLAKVTAAHYPDIDFDLLLTGVILHDIGKIRELTYARSLGYSTEGQLIGHISIGVRMVEDALRKLPEFPPLLRDLVEHMILSHHGSLEFGSPKVPMFLEAMLLHQIDNLDSKMEAMRSCGKDRRAGVDQLQPRARRIILKKERYDRPEQQAVAAAAPLPTAAALICSSASLGLCRQIAGRAQGESISRWGGAAISSPMASRRWRQGWAHLRHATHRVLR